MSIMEKTERPFELAHEASSEEGWQILEDQAQRRLKMSAEEFVRKWDRGDFLNCSERPEVLHVAILLPFVR
jgi:hypothetical protein